MAVKKKISTTAFTECDLIPPPGALTESSILYTDGHTDGPTHGRTDRLIPVYPRKNSFCGGITSDYLIPTSNETESQITM